MSDLITSQVFQFDAPIHFPSRWSKAVLTAITLNFGDFQCTFSNEQGYLTIHPDMTCSGRLIEETITSATPVHSRVTGQLITVPARNAFNFRFRVALWEHKDRDGKRKEVQMHALVWFLNADCG